MEYRFKCISEIKKDCNGVWSVKEYMLEEDKQSENIINTPHPTEEPSQVHSCVSLISETVFDKYCKNLPVYVNKWNSSVIIAIAFISCFKHRNYNGIAPVLGDIIHLTDFAK